MFVIRKSITNDEVLRTNDRKEVDRFIKQCADDWNYGLMRTWKPHPWLECVDCGPVVFHVYEI